MDVYTHVRLTARETDVLRLVAQGHTDRQTAQNLGVTVYTVKRDLQMMGARLGTACTHVGIVSTAYRLGLLASLPQPVHPVPRIRDRAMDVLVLMAQDLTDQQIGARLYLTGNTVKTHIKYLYRILNAQNRPHAVTLGYQHNLIKET